MTSFSCRVLCGQQAPIVVSAAKNNRDSPRGLRLSTRWRAFCLASKLGGGATTSAPFFAFEACFPGQPWVIPGRAMLPRPPDRDWRDFWVMGRAAYYPTHGVGRNFR